MHRTEEFEFLGKIPSEITVGDGNCAFNAFILALCDETVLEALEMEYGENELNKHFKQFIDLAAVALKEKAKLKDVKSNWQSVKKAILTLRTQNKDVLQRTLSSVMREIALDSVETDSEYQMNVTKLLGPAFEDFLSAEFNMKAKGNVPDDVIKNHPVIQEHFLNLCLMTLEEQDRNQYKALKVRYRELNLATLDNPNEINLKTQFETVRIDLACFKEKIKKQLNENIIEELKTISEGWWNETGYHSFCEQMRSDGVWAGDIELKRLARKFKVNLNCEKIEKGVNTPLEINVNKPFFDKKAISQDLLLELRSRNIIEEPNGEFCFVSEINSEDVLNERLSAIVDFDYNHWNGKLELNLPDTPENNVIIQQLKNRSVINSNLKFDRSLSYTDVIRRISDIPSYLREELQNFLKDKKNPFIKTSPTLTIINMGANHWSNTAYGRMKQVTQSTKNSKNTKMKVKKLTCEDYFNSKAYNDELAVLKNINLNFDETAWQNKQQTLIEESAKHVAAIKIDEAQAQTNQQSQWVKYTFFDRNIGDQEIYVRRSEVSGLDEALAKKLQCEEFELARIPCKKNTK